MRGESVPAKSPLRRRRWLAQVAPAVCLFLLCVAVPVLSFVVVAFTDKTLGSDARFVGLSNFRTVFSLPQFWGSLSATALFVLPAVSAKIGLGYMVAAGLERLPRSASPFLLVLSIPWLLPASLGSMLWLWLLYEPHGVLDQYLPVLHRLASNGSLLGSPGSAMICLIAFNIWRELPFWVAVMLSRRRQVPTALVEDFRLQSPSIWEMESQVMFRMMRPVVLISTGLALMWTFGEFQSIYLLTRGGPGTATKTISVLAYEIGYGGGIEIGLGMAMALAALPFLLVLVVPLLECGAVDARRQKIQAG